MKRIVLAAILFAGFSILRCTLPAPLLAAPKVPGGIATHGNVGLVWRDTFSSKDAPKFAQLRPAAVGTLYLGSKEYAQGLTLGGTLTVDVQRQSKYREVRVGVLYGF